MSIVYPTNTVIMIVAVMLAVSAGAWLSLSRGLSQTPLASGVQNAWRWGAALVLLAWLLVRLGVSINPPGGSILSAEVVFAFIGFGLLVGIGPLLISSTFRQVIRAIPATWLVGLQATRMAGIVILALLDMQLLPAAFAIPAGYGDVIVGALALPVLYLLVTRSPHARTLAIAWNGLGLLDLVNALVTGRIFIASFATERAAAGGSLLYLNEVFLIPTVIVPIFIALHAYSLYQLLSQPALDATPRLVEPASSPSTAPGVVM